MIQRCKIGRLYQSNLQRRVEEIDLNIIDNEMAACKKKENKEQAQSRHFMPKIT